jgi:hypothetical protein
LHADPRRLDTGDSSFIRSKIVVGEARGNYCFVSILIQDAQDILCPCEYDIDSMDVSQGDVTMTHYRKIFACPPELSLIHYCVALNAELIHGSCGMCFALPKQHRCIVNKNLRDLL